MLFLPEGWIAALTIDGLPYPQPRPTVVSMGAGCKVCGQRPRHRAVSMAGKLGRKCRDWRVAVRHAAVHAGVELLPETPLEVAIEFRLSPAASLLKKGGELTKPARTWPTGARDGDWDNLAKGTIDALQGILFEDDSWIVEGRARKVWALKDTRAGAVIRWREATKEARWTA